MGRILIKMWEGCSEPPRDALFKPQIKKIGPKPTSEGCEQQL